MLSIFCHVKRVTQECARRSQPVALVCTGALTNAALLVSLFPEILPKIEIVLMGGWL